MDKLEILTELGFENSTVMDSIYDAAITGFTTEGNIVYNYDKMINELMKADGMSREEAIEYVEFNAVRAIPYAPDPKPIIVMEI